MEATPSSPKGLLDASVYLREVYLWPGGLNGFCQNFTQLQWNEKGKTVSLSEPQNSTSTKEAVETPEKRAVKVLMAAIQSSPKQLLDASVDMVKLYREHSFLKKALGSGGLKGFCKKHTQLKWNQKAMTVSLSMSSSTTQGQVSMDA